MPATVIPFHSPAEAWSWFHLSGHPFPDSTIAEPWSRRRLTVGGIHCKKIRFAFWGTEHEGSPVPSFGTAHAMIFGTGIDIVDITRFERFLAEGKDSLFQRVFTPAEIEYCGRKKRSAQHFATRFAAKEAFFKASGLGLRDGMSWKDVEVVRNDLGKPRLELHGRAAAIFAELGLKMSHTALSHDGAYAVAMVVLER